MNEGEKLKHIRLCYGLKQQELANELGVSKQYLSKVESGATELSKDRIIALCEKYGISANWYLLDEGDMNILGDDELSGNDYAVMMEDYFKHDLNLELFSMYVKSANNFITYKFPNASINDIVEAAKELYSADIDSDKNFYELKELVLDFQEQGEAFKSFKERIITAYYRVASTREF